MAKNFGRVNVSVTASTGGLTAGLAQASKQLSAFRSNATAASGTVTSALAGFVGLGASATTAAIGVRVLSLAFKSLLGPLLIVTSLVEFFAFIGRSAQKLDDASKAAARLGMSMTTFQNFSLMAEEAGVGVEQLTTLLTFMTRNLGQLANGSASATKAFASLGLALADLQGLSPEQQFDLIAKRIMALPTAAERTAAAMAVFGRQGAQAMGLIQAAADGTRAELATLQRQLGVTFSDEQLNRGLPQGIEMMNDALGRLTLPLQGFINQFLGELAPAITTVSNLIVDFFAKNTAGWTLAKSLADGLVFSIRMVVGAVTLLTGIFQVFMALGSQIGQMFSEVFSLILSGVSRVMKSMAALAEAAGFEGLAESLTQGSRGAREMAQGAADMGQMYGEEAANSFASGVQNIGSPFAAFDAGFAQAQADAQSAAASTAASAAGQSIGSAIKAASSELKAIVVGSSEGESYRNMLARGGDPRLGGGDAAKETANNTERTADGVEDLASAVREIPGFGQAQLAMV